MAVKLVTRYEVDMLRAAFTQGDWEIESHCSLDDPPETLKILDWKILPLSPTQVGLRLSFENETHLKVEIKRVFLKGQFGSSHSEPRTFSVSFCDLPKRCHWEARESVGYWHTLNQGVGLVFVRDRDAPPGWPMDPPTKTYGLDEHAKRYGNGTNLLRIPGVVAQPCALLVGDVLATGEKVLSPPRRGCNSSILIHLGDDRGSNWIEVAPRLPVALAQGEIMFA